MESLSEQYHRETGLHSHYCATQPNSGKRNLVFTRKYVWWLESIIKDIHKEIINSNVSQALQTVNNTYKILNGENKEEVVTNDP